MSDSETGFFKGVWEHLLSFGAYPEESVEHRGRRRVIVGTLWVSLPYIIVFALRGMLAIDAYLAGVVLAGIAAVNLVTLLLLRRYPHAYTPIIQAPFAANILGSLAVTVMLGGLLASGVNTVWALVSVLGSLVALSVGWAMFWFGAFLVSLVFSAILPTGVEPLYANPDPEANSLINIIGVTVLIFAVMVYFVRQRDRYQQQSDDLLHNILPDDIANRLKTSDETIADDYESASILFADVVDFTPMSAGMAPTELVALLDETFTAFDSLVEERDLEKIKTIGDAYMVAAGVPTPRQDHAQVLCDLALAIQDLVASRQFRGRLITLRIGVNSGPVVAGIIGTKKFSYDLWGDSVNTASRMESTGKAGMIQITDATRRLVENDFICESQGKVEVKGKGAIPIWTLNSRRKER